MRVKKMAENLRSSIMAEKPDAYLGDKTALEIVGKVCVWLAKQGDEDV